MEIQSIPASNLSYAPRQSYLEAQTANRSEEKRSFDKQAAQQEVEKRSAEAQLSRIAGLISVGKSKGTLTGQSLREAEASLRQAASLVEGGAVAAAQAFMQNAEGKASQSAVQDDTKDQTSKAEKEKGGLANKSGVGALPLKDLATRAYQDVSNDGGVSFSSAAYLSAPHAALAVIGHEMEHVNAALAQALVEGRSIRSLTVGYGYAVDPKTGEAYSTGGVTRVEFSGRLPPPGHTGGAVGLLLDKRI